MKFLCLAYGAEEAWNALAKSEQDALLTTDQTLRDRGDLVAAVAPRGTVVRAWTGTPITSDGPFATAPVPLAGFSILDADTLDEAVALVKDSPCARAGGAVELRPITARNDDERRAGGP
jgi:hypothetical protein